MKRALLTLSILLALPLVFSGLATAQEFQRWRVEMSDPTSADQLRSFNIEFTALSIVPTDEITVRLLQNGSQVGDALTTDGGGGSGVFRVTVPQDGTYIYQLSSTSSVHDETKASTPRNVSVITEEAETIIIVEEVVVDADGNVIDDADAAADDPFLAAAAEAEAGIAAPGAAAADDEEGEVAGETDVTGEITDEAATTETDEDGEVLGAADEADESAGLIRNILIALVLLGLGYYYFFHRKSSTNSSNK